MTFPSSRAKPIPAAAMTFPVEAVPAVAPVEATPITAPAPAPGVQAPEALVGVEPIIISTLSLEEQTPEVPPSVLAGPPGVGREVVEETPDAEVPAQSVAYRAAAKVELLTGRTDTLIGYIATPEAATQASVASGVRGASEPTPETLPPGYHMTLLNPWAVKHVPESKIADTLS
ncbi:uncharacterized protein LOC131254293 [Magnolia sinica]|uniref:uncharacterized protein LOC131254293 n=1 Tax=Magnolia sinica TaxID=86752 RepID=UPI00265A2B7D|nr:uncharacterized protein LOC131254293 [Magnolia sinica]